MDTLLTDKEVQATPDTTEIEKKVADEQGAHRPPAEKCLQVKPVVEGDTVKEVHEYVCPDGSVGYQAFLKVNVKGKKMVKSFGEGKESNSRSHDWVEVTEE